MKRIFIFLLSVLSVLSVPAEELPSAQKILAMARAQLPPHPVTLTGTLKERAANGHLKKTLNVEMTLDRSAQPPRAEYRISNPATGNFQTLEVLWEASGPVFQCLENNVPVTNFNPHTEIEQLGVTWSDLSFSFLWSQDAQAEEVKKMFGKTRVKISVPRPNGHTLTLWVEKENGRLKTAEEVDTGGRRIKIIKVVSVKEFDGLWMVKDLDIIRPEQGGRTSLKIDTVEVQ